MNVGARTVLLTGASGFVGKPSLTALLARGFRVHVVSRHPPLVTPADVSSHAIDLRDPAARRDLFEHVRPTHLLHLAWHVEHGQFWTAPENEEWIATSLDIVRLFAGAGGQRAILTGTCAEYDWARSDDSPWRESDDCRPETPYGRAKFSLLQQVTAVAARAGISVAWARFFLMFGFGEDPRRLIPTMIRGLLQNEEIALSSGRQVRDFTDSRDVGIALAALLDADTVTGPVNVASGRGVSLREIGDALAHLSGRPETLLKFGMLSDREGEPRSMVANVSRLMHEVGFQFTHTLEQRLTECLDWHSKEMERS